MTAFADTCKHGTIRSSFKRLLKISRKKLSSKCFRLDFGKQNEIRCKLLVGILEHSVPFDEPNRLIDNQRYQSGFFFLVHLDKTNLQSTKELSVHRVCRPLLPDCQTKKADHLSDNQLFFSYINFNSEIVAHNWRKPTC